MARRSWVCLPIVSCSGCKTLLHRTHTKCIIYFFSNHRHESANARGFAISHAYTIFFSVCRKFSMNANCISCATSRISMHIKESPMPPTPNSVGCRRPRTKCISMHGGKFPLASTPPSLVPLTPSENLNFPTKSQWVVQSALRHYKCPYSPICEARSSANVCGAINLRAQK